MWLSLEGVVYHMLMYYVYHAVDLLSVLLYAVMVVLAIFVERLALFFQVEEIY